jgi:hypothetical protein
LLVIQKEVGLVIHVDLQSVATKLKRGMTYRRIATLWLGANMQVNTFEIVLD